ncbi:hypothetical protein MYX65_13040, partial [Acidobacteria bacterium AH-259-L09]|nr:hypothetical protein [Acidobacteria bacterium AH-259-L09]
TSSSNAICFQDTTFDRFTNHSGGIFQYLGTLFVFPWPKINRIGDTALIGVHDINHLRPHALTTHILGVHGT